jgi:uncharacterized membrane protein YqgA involved in biofilm formation
VDHEVLQKRIRKSRSRVGFEGDSSILIAKAVLDFFTAMIFATTLGKAVAAIGILQIFVYLLLFLLARVSFPMHIFV